MRIKKIQLDNFGKHSDLTVNFSKDTNVIFGKTGSGKSTVKKAITWVLTNSIKGDNVRKEGSKKTSVILTTDKNIEIEKVKSSSINRYILRIPNKEEQIFDKCGTSIPEEILEVINLNEIQIDDETINLNIADQVALPFLMDKSATFRMKLFNKLTGNDILDKLFGRFNKDILKIKRDITSTEDQKKENEIEVQKVKEEKEILDKKIEQSDVLFGIVHKNYKIYTNLLKYIELHKKREEIQTQIKNINIPEVTEIKEVTKEIEEFEQLKTVLNRLEKQEIIKDRVRDELKKIVIPALDLEEITEEIQQFESISEALNSINIKNEKLSVLKGELKSVKIDIKDLEKEHKELHKSVKICETCGQEVKNG